jgi:hypothetical protein
MDSPSHAVTQVPALVAELYAIVDRLETLFPGRSFTPDGHLVGSIGEVLAAHRYGLALLPASSQGHDAISPAGQLVEIKATQGNCVALREEPRHLIVLYLPRGREPEEVYNGPGSHVWAASGAMQARNGQRRISLSKLRALMRSVPSSERVPAVRT